MHAVIAQVPFIDGAESAKLYPLQQLPRALKLSSQDYMGAKVGLAPKTLPVIAEQQLCFCLHLIAAWGICRLSTLIFTGADRFLHVPFSAAALSTYSERAQYQCAGFVYCG